MAEIVLVVGNRNYSSWSMRPWLALKAAGVAFREVVVPLRQPDTAERIRAHSPSGRVPVLEEGGTRVWESLAICEYVAERFPEAGLWPDDPAARAAARAVSSEMHAGFPDLRRELPMNVRRDRPGIRPSPAAADIARVAALWADCRERFGAGGPFLFGRFSIADCMFGPVASRFRTYHVDPGPSGRAWMAAFWSHPAAQAWSAAAAAEPWAIPAFDDL